MARVRLERLQVLRIGYFETLHSYAEQLIREGKRMSTV